MTSSAIPAVKAALETAMRANSTLSPIVIARGLADPANPEQVEVSTATGAREYRSLGNLPTPLDETIRLTVLISVAFQGGSDYAATETRAWVLHAALEDTLRADMKLGNTWQFGRIAETNQSYWATKEDRGVQITVILEGKARI